MQITKKQLGSKKVYPFTIPSGIVTTTPQTIAKFAREIPELGILTTKSIGVEPRLGNREPILYQYAPGSFGNAVGLTNPGCEEFARQLAGIDFPEDKFLLASIFGKNEEEFVYVAKTLEDKVDGFELNLSCPHTEHVGMVLGQDPEQVSRITRAITSTSRKPVFAKLTPNTNNIEEIAKSALDARAYGITAINTVGPGYYVVNGYPVLTNKVGGMSGRGITPIGVECVRRIKQATNALIIAMGGIATARDVEAYASSGASYFGIGSSLAGMDDEAISAYFRNLVFDLMNNTNRAENFLKFFEVNTQYKKAMITGKIEASGDFMKAMVTGKMDESCDFKILRTDKHICAEPGQFVFAWIPEVGEKPFSVMDDSPLTLGVQEVGEFTRQFNQLKIRDSFYFRGPYGKGIKVPDLSNVVLVGGGCGIAGLYLLAKKLSERANVQTFLGAKDRQHLPYLEQFSKLGKLFTATEDGSLGIRGTVADLLKNRSFSKDTYFFNCGPKAMVKAVLPLELAVSQPEKVYSSVDYITRCGIGLCGSCADEKGRRTCVEGPFMQASY